MALDGSPWQVVAGDVNPQVGIARHGNTMRMNWALTRDRAQDHGATVEQFTGSPADV